MDDPTTYISYGDFGFKGEGFITPYLSRVQNPIHYGIRSGQITNITLNGQLTGTEIVGITNYSALITAQSRLVSGFSKDFQSLDVREKATDGATVLTSIQGFPISNCIVDNISFSEGAYNGILDYSISLRGYESRLFSGVSKVIDPVNSFGFSEAEDGERSITHTASAKGINTNPSGTIEGNALDNAKSFVLGLTGWSNQIMPEMIRKGDFTKYSSINPSLKSQSESANRMDGTFSVTESWVFDENNSQDATRKVNVDIESGISSDFVVATVNVEVQGDKRKSIEDIRKKVPRSNELYKIAKDNFEVMRADPSRALNPQPSSFNVNENSESKLISVSAVFSDSDISPYPVIGASNKPEGHPAKKQNYAYFDYSIDLNRDEIASSTEASIRGKIVGIGGDLRNRYSGAVSFLEGLHSDNYWTGGTGDNANVSYKGLTGFLYEKAKGQYDSFYTSSGNYNLNQTVKNLSVSPNELNGMIEVSADFDDADYFKGQYGMFNSASYSVKVSPSIPVIEAKPIISKEKGPATDPVGRPIAQPLLTDYRFFDLGINSKTKVSISCNFTPKKSAYYGREDLLAVASKDAYNLRRALKQKYVTDEKRSKKTKDLNDSSDFVRIESDTIEYDKFKGNFSVSSSYSFNNEKNYFAKLPKKLLSREDSLTDEGLD